MNHEEYVALKRREAGELARAMLDGKVDYLEGAIRLDALRSEMDIAADDEDFLSFLEIASETDHLPIGRVRERWSKEALKRLEPEIKSTAAWARKISLSNCESIERRYSTDVDKLSLDK